MNETTALDHPIDQAIRDALALHLLGFGHLADEAHDTRDDRDLHEEKT